MDQNVKLAERSDPIVGPLGFGAELPIHIVCPAFEGPLGLLLASVKSHKVDLVGVPLQPICEAYYRYVLDLATADLDQCGGAIVALSYLLERKAYALLPTPDLADDDECDFLDPFDIEPTMHEYAAAIESLRLAYEVREQHYFRTAGSESLYELPFELGNITGSDLALAFDRLMRRAVPEKPEILNKPRRSLADQMTIVARALPVEFLPLDQIVVGEFTRSEAVWWFLALLELLRLGQARAIVEGDEVLFAGCAES